MACHEVIGSNIILTVLVVMKWGDEVTAVVTGSSDVATGSNITFG